MMRKGPALALAVFVILASAALLSEAAFARSFYVDVRGHRIRVEVADTVEKTILGLSNRERLREEEGMLFLYPDKQTRTFWMKDMRFDLDIVWIAGNRIVRISRNARAEGSRPSWIYDSGVPVDKVLEINAGLCERWGIREGQQIVILER